MNTSTDPKPPLHHHVLLNRDTAPHLLMSDEEVDALLAPVRERLKRLAYEGPLLLNFFHHKDAASWPDYYALVREVKMQEDVVLHRRLVLPTEK